MRESPTGTGGDSEGGQTLRGGRLWGETGRPSSLRGKTLRVEDSKSRLGGETWNGEDSEGRLEGAT